VYPWETNNKVYYILLSLLGFVFSNDERTALVQYEGGPCAVIAPIQAFVIKNGLFDSRTGKKELSHLTGKLVNAFPKKCHLEKYSLYCEIVRK